MGKQLKTLQNVAKQLPEQVAIQIKDLVKNNQWEAGYKLPNEFEMAEMLGVGRGTVREAIKILVAQNVVEIHRGSGTFVCEKPGVSDDPFGLSFILDQQKLALDMCEIRMIIEPQIAELAAQRVTKENIQNLREICKQLKTKVENNEDYTNEDRNFHETIARCTNNQVIEQLVPLIHKSITLFMDVTKTQLKQQTVDDHYMLVEAIENHDGLKAKEIMMAHIQHNQTNIKNKQLRKEK